MEGILTYTAIAIGGLALASAVRHLMGLALRYFVFVFMAAVIYRIQHEEKDFDFINFTMAQELAIVGAISFVLTLGIMGLVFRKTPLKFLVLPATAFAVTFGVTALRTGV